MGIWLMSADLLARARFVVSPMADVVAAMGALRSLAAPSERVLAPTARPSPRMLREHPARAAVLAAAPGPDGSPTSSGCRRVADRCRSPRSSR